MRCRLHAVLFALILLGVFPLNLRAQSNPSVSYEYDNYGNCKAITNELGQKSTYAYDAYRRLTSYTEPLNAPNWNGNGTVAGRTWNWTYDRMIEDVGSFDASAHTSSEWGTQTEPAFNAAGDRKMTARTFDVNNRMLSETTGLINGETGPDTETHRYTYDENDNKVTYLDPRARLTRYTYDLRNRLQDTIAPQRDDETGNPTTTIAYDFVGNKTMVTFPDLRTQQWLDYNAFGEARQFVDERGNLTDMTYRWGPMKKLASVTTHRLKDGGGTEDQLTQFLYDGMGRLTKTTFPDATTEVSTYEFEQAIAFKTRRNQTKRMTYDARGREQASTWDSEDAPAITRAWDDAGRLAAIWNEYAVLDYAYDAAGQVKEEGDAIAGTGRAQTNYYRYPDGGVAHLIYPSGFRNRRDYTARGQLDAAGWDDASGSWVEKAINYSYFPDGKVDHQTSGNGVRSDFTYDARGLMKSLHAYRTSDSKNLTERTYTRDIRDRITSYLKGSDDVLNGLENGRGDFFSYDEEGQLTGGYYEATDSAGSGAERTEQFHYDALGNRVGSNVLGSEGNVDFTRRDNGLNQYLNWSLAAPGNYLHDDQFYGTPGNGVLMQEGMITASYNALNQPIAIYEPSLGANFVWFGYDPLGRCVKRWMAPASGGDPATNPATYFYSDSSWNLLQEGASSASVSRTYVHGARVDEIVASSPDVSAGPWYYHHYDARGHAILLTGGNGNLVEQYDYDAFGHPYFYNAAGDELTDPQLKGNRFLFTGREWLSDLGLYDYRNRLYHPLLGRFLQPDPKQFMAGDYNLYRYAHNDPVNRNDPLGEFALPGAVLGALGGIATDVLLQGGENLLEDKPFFSDLDYSSIGVSASIGFGTGGLGYGVAVQGSKAVKAGSRVYHIRQALAARRAAAAAGKFRNAAKTAKMEREAAQATKEAAQAVGRGGLGSVLKRFLENFLPKEEKPAEKKKDDH